MRNPTELKSTYNLSKSNQWCDCEAIDSCVKIKGNPIEETVEMCKLLFSQLCQLILVHPSQCFQVFSFHFLFGNQFQNRISRQKKVSGQVLRNIAAQNLTMFVQSFENKILVLKCRILMPERNKPLGQRVVISREEIFTNNLFFHFIVIFTFFFMQVFNYYLLTQMGRGNTVKLGWIPGGINNN